MRIKSIFFPTKTADVEISLEELDCLFKNGFKDVKKGKIDKYGIRQIKKSHTELLGETT